MAAPSATRVLVVTDRFMVESGLLAPSRASLEAAGLEPTVYDAVVPDPPEHLIYEAAALAREGGDDGSCVNCIAPGLTMSEAIMNSDQFTNNFEVNLVNRAIKRAEQPEDLLGAMVYLCSSDSDFVTGQTLVVDGGAAMH